MIGNSSYNTGSLRNPVNDADDIASALKRLGFDVILKKNAAQQDMEDAIRNFGDRLKRGGVGLFFYAGHGVQISGKNFLLPIGVKIDRETDVKYRAVDADMVLDEMGNAGNPMNIIILDACRDNPFGKSFRSASRGLAIISSAPRGTLISYSTNPGNVAADGSGRNSPYTGSLMKHMMTPGLPIEEVFKNVRQDLVRWTQGKQIPWELSSLEGRFYFTPQVSSQSNLSDAASSVPRPESEDLARQKATLEKEKQELAREKQNLERRKALDTEREQLAAERRKIEAERQQIAIGAPPTGTGPKDTGKDGRFIAYDNGTVWDTKTNLMWAAKDNGSDINWANAKSYCENYRGGGYTDWRMPTQDELAGLYDMGMTQRNEASSSYPLHLTELIDLTACCPWASEKHGTNADFFDFDSGRRSWSTHDVGSFDRALPVRSGKKEPLARGHQELERQRAVDAEREQLASERRKIEAEMKLLAMAKPSTVSTANEIKRDGRFIAYSDGTVFDTKTNLMWASKDNGSDINWAKAKSYCESYRGGGYIDWRMPTLDELAGLYDTATTYKSDCGLFGTRVYLTELIRLSCSWAWASETGGSGAGAAGFGFNGGERYWGHQSDYGGTRALPVRSGR